MRILAPLILLLAGACSMPDGGPNSELPPIISPILTTDDAKDPFTYARPEVARVTHVALDLTLDFEGKSVGGTATLDVAAEPGEDTVILDSDGLDITSVTDNAGAALPFAVGAVKEGKGAPVTITMNGQRKLIVTYSAKNAEALQWLEPEQTAGRKHPYRANRGAQTPISA